MGKGWWQPASAVIPNAAISPNAHNSERLAIAGILVVGCVKHTGAIRGRKIGALHAPYIGQPAGKLACRIVTTGEIAAMNRHLSDCCLILGIGLGAGLPGLAAAPAAEGKAPHAANDVYQSLLKNGVTLSGAHVAFPAPLLSDGDTPEAERAALLKLAGSQSAVQELLRNAVTAPQILKLRDEKAPDGTLIRAGSVWFAVHAGLDAIHPEDLGDRGAEAKPVEAGNMRFTSKLLDDEALKKRGITRSDPKLEWYTHVVGDLLDRIHVEATDHIRATKSDRSWVFASRTDPRFDDDKEFPNQWTTLGRGGQPQAKESAGPKRFPGGASTTKISQLQSQPGVLLVEGHFAFAEPRAWFDGAPILRSKISLVAQDQIRRLRRELAERRNKQPR
jgi:hypothetical protein